MPADRTLTAVRRRLLEEVADGALLKRDRSPPYQWWKTAPGQGFEKVRDAAVRPLVQAGYLRMEPVTERWHSHAAVLAEPALALLGLPAPTAADPLPEEPPEGPTGPRI